MNVLTFQYIGSFKPENEKSASQHHDTFFISPCYFMNIHIFAINLPENIHCTAK